MQTDVEAGLIGITALAEKLALSRRTIWRLIERGELSSVSIGRRRLIRVAEVGKWLSGCEVQTPGENASTGIARRFQAAMR